MIPVFSHIEQNDQILFWVTTDQVKGLSFHVEVIDSELENPKDRLDQLKEVLEKLDSNVSVRICYSSDIEYRKLNGFRGEAISQLGYCQKRVAIHLETRGPFLGLYQLKKVVGLEAGAVDQSTDTLTAAYQILQESGFKLSPFSEDEIKKLFPETPKNWVRFDSFVSTGHDYKAVIRIKKPKSSEISVFTLQNILKDIEKPAQVSVRIHKLNESESQVYLNQRLKHSEADSSRLGKLRLVATEDAIEKTNYQGNALFEVEFLLVLSAFDIRELKTRLIKAQAKLSKLGDVMIETFGVLPSLAASYPGALSHVNFLETGDNVCHYLPITGVKDPSHKELTESSLIVHRDDESLASIDLLSAVHLNANCLVIGGSGRGKSAFTGMLTRSLFNDPRTYIMKVDVGGSHSRQCTLIGGKEHILRLDRPSGLNPFQSISESLLDESTRAIISNFICVLIQAENEAKVPKTISIEVEEALKSYQLYLDESDDQKNQQRSLDGFSDFLSNSKPPFSRLPHLKRWSSGGLYANAFKQTDAKLEIDSRYTYYNFSEIFQATDPDFAQAGMAAVLADFNLNLKKLFNQNKRLVLICDETPVFISKCFEFFKFSAANVRKFGASLILVVQNSEDLIQQGDTGVIENSTHRILMAVDGKEDVYQERFKLTDEQMDSVKNLKSIPKKYSEFLYKFGDRAFKARLRLTANEYWQVTTTKAEKIKIDLLMQNVPGLQLEEAISCLAIHG